MVQSVELTLDPVTDAAIRTEWGLLAAAGLPSQANHHSESNRPHVTLLARSALSGPQEAALRVTARGAVPLGIRLGAPLVFGGPRFVLVRALVLDTPLLELHRSLYDAAGPDPAPMAVQTSPGRWVPHVTLGRRLTGAQVGEALGLLCGGEGGRGGGGSGSPSGGEGGGGGPGAGALREATATGIRRWDGEARREWLLS